jgi:hypothetical protein
MFSPEGRFAAFARFRRFKDPNFDSRGELTAIKTIKIFQGLQEDARIRYFVRGRPRDLAIGYFTSKNRMQLLVMKTDQITVAEHVRAYRRRIKAVGEQEVLFKLPNETVALIDEIKQRYGLSNRGQALLQLIKQGRAVAQQQT